MGIAECEARQAARRSSRVPRDSNISPSCLSVYLSLIDSLVVRRGEHDVASRQRVVGQRAAGHVEANLPAHTRTYTKLDIRNILLRTRRARAAGRNWHGTRAEVASNPARSPHHSVSEEARVGGGGEVKQRRALRLQTGPVGPAADPNTDAFFRLSSHQEMWGATVCATCCRAHGAGHEQAGAVLDVEHSGGV